MSSKVISIIAGLILLGIVAICIGPLVWHKHLKCINRANIESVGKQINKVLEESLGKAKLVDKYWNQTAMFSKAIDGLYGIDVSGCPEDFKKAYMLFINEMERRRDLANKYGGWNGFLKGAINPMAVFALIEQDETSQEGLAQSVSRLRTVAKSYDVNSF